MFKIFKKQVDPAPLLSSELFNEHSFYKEFSKDIRIAYSRIIIESPYITSRRAREISSMLRKAVNRGVKVTIYTRNPYHHDGILVTESINGIGILREAGVTVITCEDMRHRKLAVIDGYILWEGSLNMLSQNGSKEVMRRSVSNELCQQMLRFIRVE
jgi:phosphatidylserine/phosphatidylglycerophosphate/cardiolipin synthase-like enzyme